MQAKAAARQEQLERRVTECINQMLEGVSTQLFGMTAYAGRWSGVQYMTLKLLHCKYSRNIKCKTTVQSTNHMLQEYR